MAPNIFLEFETFTTILKNRFVRFWSKKFLYILAWNFLHCCPLFLQFLIYFGVENSPIVLKTFYSIFLFEYFQDTWIVKNFCAKLESETKICSRLHSKLYPQIVLNFFINILFLLYFIWFTSLHFFWRSSITFSNILIWTLLKHVTQVIKTFEQALGFRLVSKLCYGFSWIFSTYQIFLLNSFAFFFSGFW